MSNPYAMGNYPHNRIQPKLQWSPSLDGARQEPAAWLRGWMALRKCGDSADQEPTTLTPHADRWDRLSSPALPTLEGETGPTVR